MDVAVLELCCEWGIESLHDFLLTPLRLNFLCSILHIVVSSVLHYACSGPSPCRHPRTSMLKLGTNSDTSCTTWSTFGASEGLFTAGTASMMKAARVITPKQPIKSRSGTSLSGAQKRKGNKHLQSLEKEWRKGDVWKEIRGRYRTSPKGKRCQRGANAKRRSL